MFPDISNLSMLVKRCNSLNFTTTSEKLNNRRSVGEKSNNVKSISEKQNDKRSIKGESNCRRPTSEKKFFEGTNNEWNDGVSLPGLNMMIIINQVIRA